MADVDSACIGLGNVSIGAQRGGLGDAVEQRVAGIDESADIDIALGDDAVKRGANDAVGLHVSQPRNVG